MKDAILISDLKNQRMFKVERAHLALMLRATVEEFSENPGRYANGNPPDDRLEALLDFLEGR